MEKFNVVIIGSGPGGYVAAIRASQLGMKTAIVERAEIGGVCLNWGCIPTKALLKSAHLLTEIKSAAKFGIKVSDVQPDFKKIIQRSRTVANQVSKGIEFLLKKNNITVLQGYGRIYSKNTVEITPNDSEKYFVETDYIIIATGARARQLPGLEIDGQRVIGYRQAMTLEEQPESMLVIGSGAIGVELASFYAALGTKITIVEILPRVVPTEDEEVSAELEKHLKRQRMKIYTSSTVKAITPDGDKTKVLLETPEGSKEITVDKVFSAIGITPNTEDIGLEKLNIKTEKGRIIVDEYYRTCIDNIFAIGDVIATPALAHVASAEGITAVEYIAGLNPQPINYSTIPAGIFTHPEIASVGMREHQAKEKGINYRTGKFPYSALGKSTAIGSRDGFVKLIFDEKDQLIGAHIIGENATDMIAELVVSMNGQVSGKHIIKSVHPHPTLSEAIMEAAAAAHGEAIHI